MLKLHFVFSGLSPETIGPLQPVSSFYADLAKAIM